MPNAARHLAGLLTLAMTLAWGPASAQWIDHPTPRIPRTADGRADLSAPAPRAADGKPELSGMWGWRPGRYFGGLPQDLKPEVIKPGALALVAERQEHMNRDVARARGPQSASHLG